MIISLSLIGFFSYLQNRYDMIKKTKSLWSESENDNAKIMRKYLLLIMITTMIIILVFHYNTIGMTLVNEKQRSFQNKMNQLISVIENNDVELKTLTESLNEDYLTRTIAFAYLIKKDSSILKKQS